MSEVLTIVNMIPRPSSGEAHQDSEPNLAVNPTNPLEMAATAFTPSPNVRCKNSPIFYSNDGGSTWSLKDIIAGTPVRDQTLRFATTSGNLYAGVLWGRGFALINFDILRANDFSGLTTMSQLARRRSDDQPFVQATTVPTGPSAGEDRLYVGSNDHAPLNIPATVDLSLNAGAPVPAINTFRIEGRSVIRDGFQTRPAVHPNGTVYAIFYSLLADHSCDVVIVRDDDWASGATPFNALVDPGDGNQGMRIVAGVNNPFNSLYLGQQRIGGDLSIAVDPSDSATVYVCWGDQQGGTYTLYVRKSINSGATWTGNLRTIANATNPALAINSRGRLGFLYQQVTGLSPNQRWETTLELTTDDFASITTYVLANTPANTPEKDFDPYLGDYLYMMALGESFYGIFSANNEPDNGNFPNGVTYQRNANFATKTLLDVHNVTRVPTSIDPFFFKVEPMKTTYRYSVKFVCGKSEGKVLSRGHYYTAINVHNPSMQTAKIRRKISTALPAETAGHVVDLGVAELHSDKSFEIDCPDIYRLARMSPGCLLKGFVILESLVPLEVVAVYTASGGDKKVETIHTERVPAFKVECEEKEEPRPDLVPVPDPQVGFCKRVAGTLVVTVKNQGNADAPPSTTRAIFSPGGTVDIPTPPIPAGVSVDLPPIPIPGVCYNPDCEFTIIVDAKNEVPESNKTNNSVTGVCKG